MTTKETIEKRVKQFETQSPVLLTLLTNMTYEDAKLLSDYRKWHIIKDV